MHHPTDRIAHTTAFVTPVVEHWLKQEGVSIEGIYIYVCVCMPSIPTLSCSGQCSTTGVTKAVVCAILSVVCGILSIYIYKEVVGETKQRNKCKNIWCQARLRYIAVVVLSIHISLPYHSSLNLFCFYNQIAGGDNQSLMMYWESQSLLNTAGGIPLSILNNCIMCFASVYRRNRDIAFIQSQ